MTEGPTIDPEQLLLNASEARDALGPGMFLEMGGSTLQAQQLGSVLNAAAAASAYRSFSGRAQDEERSIPIKVGLMALVFSDAAVAQRMFGQVAQASHLRTKLGAVDVSVETVTAQGGLVSYWSYLSLGPVMVIATLDTLDPARVSISEFRSLVTRLSAHVESALGR